MTRVVLMISLVITMALTLAGCFQYHEDSDKDGVINEWDQCDDTPQGVPTDGDGCPMDCPSITDADSDGVIDSWDECADTPQGTPTDSKGCPAKRTVIIPLYDTAGDDDGGGDDDCQGCCSEHGGVVCNNGVTECGDGTELSETCMEKGCNACP